MSTYTDAELEKMLVDLESDLVERKQSFSGDAPQAVREAICALANDLAGHARAGVVFVGACNDGTPTGLSVTDALLLQLSGIKTEGNIVPPPSILVDKRRLQGHDIAVVTVLPCDSPPVRFKGRIHVRWGPRRGYASPQDERILNERRRHRDRPFYRNPNLAEALRALGFVQRFGAGIAIARKALGERLRFEVQQGFIAVIIARGEV